MHRNILKKEIEIINPHCIITLGNDSRDSIIKMSNKTNNKKLKPAPWIKKNIETNEKVADLQMYEIDSYSVISSPHISTSANGAKAALIRRYADFISEEQKDTDTLKMAKIISKKIKEI